jgi:hypothetical protein
MNQETKLALQCGARLRQVVTDILGLIEYVDTKQNHHDAVLQRERLRQAVDEVKKLLMDNGLFERVYPLEPFDNEQFRQACVRTFGNWITYEVLGNKETSK